MTEDLIDNLSKMGLTSKQARVYLSIAINKKTKISEITKETKIHEQDVSKILPKLEQIGLIIKSATKPIIVEAIPLKIALEGLIKKEQENLDEQKKNVKKIIETIKNKDKNSKFESEEIVNLMDCKSQCYKNDLSDIAAQVRKNWIVMGTRTTANEYFKYYLPFFKNNPEFKKYKINIRVIVQTTTFEKDFFAGIDTKEYSDYDISIKILTAIDNSLPFLVYSIIDDKQLRAILWDSNQTSKVVSTNCEPIIKIGKENFERAWQDTNALLIFHKGKLMLRKKKSVNNMIQ